MKQSLLRIVGATAVVVLLYFGALPFLIKSDWLAQKLYFFEHKSRMMASSKGREVLLYGVTAQVEDVAKDSAAEDAGLKRGDIVVSVNGKRVEEYSATRVLLGMRETKPLKLTIIRGVPLNRMAENVSEALSEATTHCRLDLEFKPGVKAKRKFLNGLKLWSINWGKPGGGSASTSQGSTGIMSNVSPDSAAGAAGLKKGDILLALDGQQIKNWRYLVYAMKSGDKKKYKLTILRGNPAFERPNSVHEAMSKANSEKIETEIEPKRFMDTYYDGLSYSTISWD